MLSLAAPAPWESGLGVTNWFVAAALAIFAMLLAFSPMLASVSAALVFTGLLVWCLALLC